jgi:hypothetical protein
MASQSTSPATFAGPRGWAIGVILAVFLALTLPPILTGNLRGRGAGDQLNFHEPTIRALAADWPRFDFRGEEYLTATTPGYHLALAAGAKAGLGSPTGQRLLGLALSVGFLLTLALWVGRRCSAWETLAIGLPVASSLYVFNSGAWMLPDNTGWWGVLGVLLIALRPKFDARMLVGGGVILVLLVLVRQVHLWAAGVLWAAAWMGPAAEPERPLLADPNRRIPRTVLAIGAAVPAFAILAIFMRHWGGLTPPNFQNYYPGLMASLRGGNILDKAPLAAPAFILSLLGLGSVFFGAYFAGPLLELSRRRPWAPAAAALAGLLAAAIPATTYSKDGRWSGIWNATKKLPAIADHSSPLILALATGGAVCLLGWCVALRQRERWIMLGALAGFTAAQAASGQLWQRYSEPFILIVLALMATLVSGPHAAPATPLLRRLRIAGPLALAGVLLLVTVTKLATDKAPTLKKWDPATTSTTAPAE